MYNIDPALWGGSMWVMLHYITFAYPENPTKTDIDDMRTFFMSAGKVLPCEKCRYHYSQNLQKHPLTDEVLKSRYKLITWLVDLHNEVNKQTGKPLMTLDDAIQRYMYKKSDWGINPTVLNILILLLVIVVILVLYR